MTPHPPNISIRHMVNISGRITICYNCLLFIFYHNCEEKHGLAVKIPTMAALGERSKLLPVNISYVR